MKCGATLPDDARDEAGVLLNRAITIRCGLSAFHGKKFGKQHKVNLPGGIKIRWPGIGSMCGEWDENTPKYNENGNRWYGPRG